eukprot:11206281-Lingulodinium_polyedra.AAC.1
MAKQGPPDGKAWPRPQDHNINFNPKLSNRSNLTENQTDRIKLTSACLTHGQCLAETWPIHGQFFACKS